MYPNKYHTIMAAAVAATLVFAGCTASGEAAYSYDSSKSGAAGGANLKDVDDTFQIDGGSARISFSIGGAGSAEVTVRDATGAAVYTESIQTGGAASSATMRGEPGTWRIVIDFTNWSGGFALDIREV